MEEFCPFCELVGGGCTSGGGGGGVVVGLLGLDELEDEGTPGDYVAATREEITSDEGFQDTGFSTALTAYYSYLWEVEVDIGGDLYGLLIGWLCV